MQTTAVAPSVIVRFKVPRGQNAMICGSVYQDFQQADVWGGGVSQALPEEENFTLLDDSNNLLLEFKLNGGRVNDGYEMFERIPCDPYVDDIDQSAAKTVGKAKLGIKLETDGAGIEMKQGPGLTLQGDAIEIPTGGLIRIVDSSGELRNNFYFLAKK